MLAMKSVSVPVPRVQATRLHAATTGTEANSLGKKLKVGGYFALWYAFNIGYNIYNKKVLNLAPDLPWIVGLLQLVLGLVYVLPLWLTGYFIVISVAYCDVII